MKLSDLFADNVGSGSPGKGSNSVKVPFEDTVIDRRGRRAKRATLRQVFELTSYRFEEDFPTPTQMNNYWQRVAADQR